MKVIVLMAGSSEAFYKNGNVYPKFLTEINNQPLAEHIYNNVKSLSEDLIFIINKEDAQMWHLDNVLKLLSPKNTILTIDGETQGAACSALFAIEHINNEEELVILNGDQLFKVDLKQYIKDLSFYDAGTIIFESVHPRWSYVLIDDNGLVQEASEKRPISKHATAGIYYFKTGKLFVSAASEMIMKDAHVNNKFYICPTFNELILKSKKVGVSKIKRDQYISLTTPESINHYQDSTS